MNGPILKDWQYYSFWTAIVLGSWVYLYILKRWL